ncbi:cyclic AMP-dependent transcription factor ATF-6 beta-like [Acanthaster planci]|uniref:Cyclic AMP-dependent transcription factor ATF-6 beta-like n=1 Tax=Acanthaster planci TaxID=133434 RepID=A0A8B7XZF2_ACAPL|nr:cyclic AMP-dependent transcription factor ATF-6 beta-like [Acanthaster planci]
MALDFISTPDTRFLADNLLSSEDWGDDFSHFHDNGLGSGFPDADELVRDFTTYESDPTGSDSTGHGMLDDTTFSDYPWIKGEQQSLCTIEGIAIKSEPLSPPPSSSSSDASGDSFPPVKNFPNPLLQVKLESPPLTPPRDNADVQHFPLANGAIKTTTVPRIAPKNPAKSTVPPIAPKGPHQQQTGKPSATKPIPVGQPIVLTQADVARLTAQGVIKCQPPPAKQAKVASDHTVASSIPVATKPANNQQPPANVDLRAWKRQQRMIKNRESACLSRKKKKEYLQGLEGRMESIDQENVRLREENGLLRKRVEELTNENNRLRKTQSLLPSSNKTTTCLLAVMLLLGFNLAPFSIFSSQGDDYSTSRHGGRALLGYTETPPSLSQSQGSDLRQHTAYSRIEAAMHNVTDENGAPQNPLSRKELMVIRDMADYMLSKEQPSCPQFNVTESHRLADVLMGWAQKHQDEQRKHNQEQQIKEKKRKIPKKKPAKRSLFRWRNPQPLFVDPDETGLQVYDSLFQRTYANLLDSLERREDTFYVVSFRRDHTLLPATAHNNTQRPRMSLVMPSVGVNESSLNQPKDRISMMQIDCEVMNTKMVYLKESHIPSTQNTTVTNHTGTKPTTHGGAQRMTAPTSDSTTKFHHPKNLSARVPLS